MREIGGAQIKFAKKAYSFSKCGRKELFENKPISTRAYYDYDISKIKEAIPSADFTRRIQRTNTLQVSPRVEIDFDRIQHGIQYLQTKTKYLQMMKNMPRDDKMYSKTELDRMHKVFYTSGAKLAMLELKRKLQIE
jgi:hypothetical protein